MKNEKVKTWRILGSFYPRVMLLVSVGHSRSAVTVRALAPPRKYAIARGLALEHLSRSSFV